MQFTTRTDSISELSTDALIIGIAVDQPFEGALEQINHASEGLLEQLDQTGELPRKTGKTLVLHRPRGLAAARLIVVGLGKADKLDGVVFVKAAQAAGKSLRQSRAVNAHCLLSETPVRGRDRAWVTRQAAMALAHSNYLYSATKKVEKDAAPATESVSFPEHEGAGHQLAVASALAAGVQTARDLGDLPPNVCTPIYLAEIATRLAEEIDRLEVEILDEDQMAELGMNALLAVGQGSVNPSRLIRMRWRGGKDDDAPLAMVGKGVTFDTGGISIKPRELMEQMKFDMCGAASTIGAVEAVARLGLPINVDGVVAAVENMPDGKAYRPGDVITAMNGKTIEVHNTDAEGRMILADAIYWTGQNSKPKAMVDIAALTGACVVALGHHASGVMTQNDELAAEILSAGDAAADRAWRLPLWDDYQEQIETPFADMKNLGGMPAGSITAGCFLSRFADGQRWAHIDIAGSAWQWGKPESATGRPVGLLVEWLVGHAGGWGAVG